MSLFLNCLAGSFSSNTSIPKSLCIVDLLKKTLVKFSILIVIPPTNQRIEHIKVQERKNRKLRKDTIFSRKEEIDEFLRHVPNFGGQRVG